ncbi:MAG: carbohydrate porin, partial [Caulobacteraceae bacterium]|nr:carbohydrate porin [Caulobacteraceae bacterium]
MRTIPIAWLAALGLAPFARRAAAQSADPSPTDQVFAIHGQATFIDQGTLAFRSPYRGPNSLDPAARGRETVDVTAYLGLRTWKGGEVWIDPEIDQGFGLDDTLGVAGFPSGEAYKVGRRVPYFRLQRFFFRQTVDLAGKSEKVDADLNQLAGSHTDNRLVITIGKFGVTDVFDTNKFANSARTDFMNWTMINSGTFDYAADSWGYTAGAAAEWYRGRWALRVGAFALSDIPNDVNIDTHFDQAEAVAEIEERHPLGGQPGKVKLTGYLNRGRMGRLDDAVALAAATGERPDVALVRRYHGRPGVSINVEQQVSDNVGFFFRFGEADGAYEAYEFTDVDRSASGGVS